LSTGTLFLYGIAVSQDRDDLIGQRDAARDHTAGTRGNGNRSAGDVPIATSSPAVTGKGRTP